MTDRIDTAALRALLDKATPGPWGVGPDVIGAVRDGAFIRHIVAKITPARLKRQKVSPEQVSADYELIAAAINALPELLRVYQAVADAPEGEVVESGWDDDDERDGSVYGIASAMIGQRVRLVPSSGEGGMEYWREHKGEDGVVMGVKK